MKRIIIRIKILFSTLILVFVSNQQHNTHAQSARPRLELTSSGNIRIMAHPGLQYQLQKTHNLTHPIAWQSLEEVKKTIESEWVNWSILPIGGHQAYFRVLVTDFEMQEGLSLAEAEKKVINEVIKPDELAALALGLRWSEPLSAGVMIQPINQTPANNLAGWRVNEESYFFVIDQAPSQKLGHPFTWVLVGRFSGAIHTFHSFYPPQIGALAPFTTLANRWDSSHRFYPVSFEASQLELADFYELEFPDTAEDSDLYPQYQEHDRANTFQTLQFRSQTESTVSSTIDCSQTTPKMVAVVVASGADDEIQNDARDMGNLLKSLGFSVSLFTSATDSLITVQKGIELAAQGLGPCD